MPIINFKDDNFTFKYVEFQLMEFNENRITGNDPLVSNLTPEGRAKNRRVEAMLTSTRIDATP